MRRVVERFGVEVRLAYQRHGFRNQREVAQKAGLEQSVVSRMFQGTPPGTAGLMKWARLIGEPVEKWASLAEGYDWKEPADPLSHGVLSPPTPPASPPVQVALPAVPAAILEAIEAAEGREDKLAIAYGYLKSLQAKGLIRFGADKSDVYDVRLHIVRAYEQITGQRLLGPEVG